MYGGCIDTYKTTPFKKGLAAIMDIKSRVATAQGKQGIWFFLFPDRENTGNFVITQGKFLRHRENIIDCIH